MGSREGIVHDDGLAQGDRGFKLGKVSLQSGQSNEVFKGLAWRLRPVACMQDELDKVPRKLKELTAIVRQPAQANLSFPSGDAAGGAVFATAVTLAAPGLRGRLPGVSLVPISMTNY